MTALEEQVTVGSRWYVWGEHVVVTALGEFDGAKTVFAKIEKTGKHFGPSFPVRALLKHGVRKEEV